MFVDFFVLNHPNLIFIIIFVNNPSGSYSKVILPKEDKDTF